MRTFTRPTLRQALRLTQDPDNSSGMPAAYAPIRSFQWDLARQVERLDFLLKWLPERQPRLLGQPPGRART